jgi:NAD(P)-dependent dehydrogenase (short-subunit alcohol dehydrogenase family)
MERLTGRRALITGAASGIGRATALRFSSEGAHVCCADLNEGGAAETAASIVRAGGEAFELGLDVADAGACEGAVAAAVERFGGLDVLCNIAGMLRNGKTEDFPVDVFDQMIAVNLAGVFYMSRAAIPQLLDSGGSIVNLASVAGLQGVPYGAAYSATKAGVIGLTRAMAAEYSRRGVRVNAICPGAINTPMIASGFQVEGGADPKLMAKLMPMIKRIGEPSEIAALAAYLASDEAAYMTGVAIPIDGGQLC